MSDLTREIVNQTPGMVVLEFGASWCGHCHAVRPLVEVLLAQNPTIHHFRIEDGRGLPLGRSFHVKLWPTFVFLRDGVVVARIVRPSKTTLTEGFEKLMSALPESASPD